MTVIVQFIREMDETLLDYLAGNLEGIDLEIRSPKGIEEVEAVADRIHEADVIIGWRPSYELLQAATKARVFINPGVGVKRHIEPFRKLNAERDVPLQLLNGHGNAYFTAEHAVAMLHAIYNKIVPYHNSMVSGAWRSTDPGGSFTLRHKTVGLLGYGAINKYVHQFLSGYEVNFAALKRSWEGELENLKQYTPDQLHEFLKAIDVLMVAIPHTSETEGMIGPEEFRLLGKDCVVVNVARGVVIQQEAFFKALKNKVIAGAGIDVWYNYQPTEDENGAKYPADYEFHDLDNVVLSPHRAASPFDNLERWDEQIENLKRIAAGRTDLLNLVNLDLEY